MLDHHVVVDLITEENSLNAGANPDGFRRLRFERPNRAHRSIGGRCDGTPRVAQAKSISTLLILTPRRVTESRLPTAQARRVANMEFMQFHPTCLYHPGARTFLISEAVRGEGAILRNHLEEDFVRKTHPMGSLAPRDIVARAIDVELKRSGEKHVWLDISGIEDFAKKFPHIHETCVKFGIDPARGKLPVVPATHYTCGGVWVDENAKSTLEGLYAVGEVACTGLHGANRLASNSLLEAIVWGHRAVQHAVPILQQRARAAEPRP